MINDVKKRLPATGQALFVASKTPLQCIDRVDFLSVNRYNLYVLLYVILENKPAEERDV